MGGGSTRDQQCNSQSLCRPIWIFISLFVRSSLVVDIRCFGTIQITAVRRLTQLNISGLFMPQTIVRVCVCRAGEKEGSSNGFGRFQLRDPLARHPNSLTPAGCTQLPVGLRPVLSPTVLCIRRHNTPGVTPNVEF